MVVQVIVFAIREQNGLLMNVNLYVQASKPEINKEFVNVQQVKNNIMVHVLLYVLLDTPEMLREFVNCHVLLVNKPIMMHVWPNVVLDNSEMPKAFAKHVLQVRNLSITYA